MTYERLDGRNWCCSKCGNLNPAAKLNCLKCDHQRWSQLEFTRRDAAETLMAFAPTSIVREFRVTYDKIMLSARARTAARSDSHIGN